MNNEGLAIPAGTIKEGKGRPFKLIKFHGENNYIIGIDLGTTSIRGVLANLNAEVIKEVELETKIKTGVEGVFDQVNRVISKLINTQSIDINRIHGIGMAIAGLINKRTNIIEFSPAFNWKNVKVEDLIQTPNKYPIVFDNVTRVMALGELRYGIGLKYRNFICVNVGFGIGGGIIIDGQPLMGTDGMSGEIGHVTVEKNSKRLCSCGNYGCLQALASGEGMTTTAREQLEKGKKSVLTQMCKNNLDELDAKMIVEAAKMQDQLALSILEEAIGYIALHIADLIKIFNPQAVVVSGGVSFNGDIFFEPLKRIINEHIMPNCSTKVEILPGSNHGNATIMGALSLILNEVLNLNFNNQSIEKT
jgi:glucokinase-like ROK family protein